MEYGVVWEGFSFKWVGLLVSGARSVVLVSDPNVDKLSARCFALSQFTE